ncbi:hypothetical protein [Methylobacterium sp. Leaf91]|uniref:hypothetical protein n=1 Tax=Methylobacterium sp. Leaf91 TaxID=1736247 RepID=UPI000AEB4918|nr:hypothetical protein [Methylobacterium sp. Leaf91]
MMIKSLTKFGFIAVLMVSVASPLLAQAPQGSNFQQRMTNALGAAKKSADELNMRSKDLQEAINKAADPEQARKFLDDLMGSSSSALDAFGDNSEMMKAVNSLLSYIDERKKNAETEAVNDPRWIERLDSWKAQADNVRQLRQDILKEADRAGSLLNRLKKDRKYIEDIIAGENVSKAKSEMEAALRNLSNLGDSLSEAVKVAEEKNNKLKSPSF